jgi:hypothetical protein
MQITEMCPNCGSKLALDMGVSEIECPHCLLTLEVEISFDDQPDTPPAESAEDWTSHNVSTQIRIVGPESTVPPIERPAPASTMPTTDTGNLIDSKIAAAAKNDEIKVAKPVQADFITSITEHERMAGNDALHVVEEEALRLAAETRREAEEAMRAIEEAKRAAFADAERAKEAAEEAKCLAMEEAQRARDAAEEVKRAAEAEAERAKQEAELAKQKAVEEAKNARAAAASLKRQQAIAAARREAEEKARRVLAEKQSQSEAAAAEAARRKKIEEAKKKAVEVARQKAIVVAKEKARRKAQSGDKGKNDGPET